MTGSLPGTTTTSMSGDCLHHHVMIHGYDDHGDDNQDYDDDDDCDTNDDDIVLPEIMATSMSGEFTCPQ